MPSSSILVFDMERDKARDFVVSSSTITSMPGSTIVFLFCK